MKKNISYQLYKLPKPVKSTKPTFELFTKYLEKQKGNLGQLEIASKPVYLYWDRLRYKQLPSKMSSPEEFWAIVKVSRIINSTPTIIKTENGSYFNWVRLPQLEEMLHNIDLETGGSLELVGKNFDSKHKQRFIARGIMEEAIASSQLEGANTARKVAKQLILEGKRPKTEGEQMIVNKHQSLLAIENDYKDKKITKEALFELHAMLVKDTAVPEDEIGRLRMDEDEIGVVGKNGAIVYHEPPSAVFLKSEMDRLISFANDELEVSQFLHPVIKAIMLHFWIGYLHPFTDGNGRLARIIFYWYLLKKGYWAFSYLPISTKIRKSYNDYRDAFIYSEQDDLDLTYFIDYNIRIIKAVIDDFGQYAARISRENGVMNNISKIKHGLNERQIRLLQYYYQDKTQRTTLTMHMNVNQISKATAIKDLKMLESLGYISFVEEGRKKYYFATKKVDELFASIEKRDF